jgi:hypothetical protein
MPTKEYIEELVDRTIDEILKNKGKPEDEIKKRQPKPFKYLSDEEIQIELTNSLSRFSVMKDDSRPNIVDDRFCILGLGDVETIENVLKKHSITKKF